MAHASRPDVVDYASQYNYEHFSLQQRTLDLLGGVHVGEPAPDFTATRLDGTEVRLSDFRGRTVVLETGSASCPMYVRNIEPMNALAYRFPEVEFLLLYVREAHPGSGSARTTAWSRRARPRASPSSRSARGAPSSSTT